MTRTTNSFVAALLIALVTGAAGCKDKTDGAPAPAEAASESTSATNRLDIPKAVRSNLGITFATVERRRVEQTLRVPGRFELQPTARREYRTMLPGRVEMHVDQFDRVESGELLYRIDSPGWRELQQQLGDATTTIALLEAKLEAFGPLMEAHEQHRESLDESVAIWTQRVTQLDQVRQAGGGRTTQFTEARSALASARAELSNVIEKQAEMDALLAETRANRGAATSRLDLLLDTAASFIGLSSAELRAPVETPDGSRPTWCVINHIEVTATDSGVVETLGMSNGSWADEKSAVLTLIQPNRLRFQASGLQSDIGALRDGLSARIVPPVPTKAGRSVDMQNTMEGTLKLGLTADPFDRTIDLYVTPTSLQPWARAGISAQLEIVTDATARPSLAIPMAAVQRDGLVPVIFRRDPANANMAIRLEADLGINDGRWVTVLSGIRDGDEIVLDGAFQLMLATSGTIQKGGHFHADGTFHEGED